MIKWPNGPRNTQPPCTTNLKNNSDTHFSFFCGLTVSIRQVHHWWKLFPRILWMKNLQNSPILETTRTRVESSSLTSLEPRLTKPFFSWHKLGSDLKNDQLYLYLNRKKLSMEKSMKVFEHNSIGLIFCIFVRWKNINWDSLVYFSQSKWCTWWNDIILEKNIPNQAEKQGFERTTIENNC
jgi:hypothetical protein